MPEEGCNDFTEQLKFEQLGDATLLAQRGLERYLHDDQ